MAADSDPREWLRAEEQQIAKLRRRAERSQTRTRTAALVLWAVAIAILFGVIAAAAWFASRNRRTLRRLIS